MGPQMEFYAWQTNSWTAAKNTIRSYQVNVQFG
jgi:hypothetical protein